jgi:hypothetical protein
MAFFKLLPFGHWTGSSEDTIIPFLGVPSST